MYYTAYVLVFNQALNMVVAIPCNKILKLDKLCKSYRITTLTQMIITSNNEVFMKLQTRLPELHSEFPES